MTHALKIIKREERIIHEPTDIEILTAEEADKIKAEKKRAARARATGNSPAEKLARWNMILKNKESLVARELGEIKSLKAKIKKMTKLINEQEEL